MPLPNSWSKKRSWFELHEKAISQIAFEIEQIDALLDSYSELLQRARANTPDLIEITKTGQESPPTSGVG